MLKISVCITFVLGFFLISFAPNAQSENSQVSVSAGQIPDLQIKLKYATFDPLQTTPAAPANFKLNTTGKQSAEKLYIVQFEGPILPQWKGALLATGAKIYDYLPDFAFLCRLTDGQLQQVRGLDFVRWTGAFQPYYKFAPQTFQPNDAWQQEMKVVFLADIAPADLLAVIQTAGGTLKSPLPALNTTSKSSDGYRTLLVKGDSMVAQRLASSEAVIWLEQRLAYRTADATSARIIQRGEYTGNPPPPYPVWQLGITGAGPNPATGATLGTEQLVAVSDSGVAMINSGNFIAHQDFQGPSYPNATVFDITNYAPLGGLNVPTGVDPDQPDGSDTNKYGHGSHVASILAGSGAASGGDATYNNTAHKGIAYGARLYVQQLGSYKLEFLTASPDPDPITTLMQDAYNKGARIQNNSWGGPKPDNFPSDYVIDARAVDLFTWEHKDFLGVWGAGNLNFYGLINGKIYIPSNAKNALSVGASVNAEGRRSHFAASYSSFGPTSDGRWKPDLVAPGGEIDLLTGAFTECVTAVLAGTTNQYQCISGTSMSAPVASGAAALVREWYIHNKNYATPSAALLKVSLMNSGVYMIDEDDPTARYGQGWGRILLTNIIQPTGGGRFTFVDNNTGLNTGEVSSYIYNVTSISQTLKINLTWTDYPGANNAAKALVNDLDLQVYAPDGTLYNGNNFQGFEGEFSVVGGQADRKNNVEGVTIKNPAVGNWRVVVRAFNVPQGAQPFALAVRGAISCPGSTATKVTISDETSISDCGVSLRQALNNSSSTAPNNLVDLTGFAPGSVIYPRTALPAIKTGVTLAGNCSGSPKGKPNVMLDGRYLTAANSVGLQLPNNTTVRAVGAANFNGVAVMISGNNVTVECSYIGTLDGVNPAPNAMGVRLEAGVNNVTFGRTGNALYGNLISGNTGYGLDFGGNHQNIQLYNTYIGYKSNGSERLRNATGGLRVVPGVRLFFGVDNKISY
jgi:serine protease AprX